MRFRASTLVLACLLATFGTVSSARAGLDVDLGASVRIGNSTDVFFAVSSRYFERDRGLVERWGGRYANPDHLAVALFISKHSGASLEALHRSHRAGTSWWEIAVRVGVPMDVWFVPVERTPGPPYGKAYGYWKKHRRNAAAARLSDAEVADLVAVRMMHDYYSMPVEVAMQRCSSRYPISVLVSNEYHERHGKRHARTTKGADAPGKKSKKNKKGKGR